jgi:2-polyprenyl-3-methyl-5-hydroxy-6-metoxy-1,4-benzoquinol methylase
LNTSINGTPDFALIQGLEDALLRAAAVRAALELDLFTLLFKGCRRPEEIVAATGYSERGVRTILDALCPIGLITKNDDEYQLTPTSDAFLVATKPTYYGQSCLRTTLSLDATGKLAESVRTKKALASHAFEENAGHLWASDFAPFLAIWPQRAEAAAKMWKTLRGRYVEKADLRLLDVGCGDGTKSFVLARSRPAAQVTAMDLHPEVLEVAARMADVLGVLSQSSFRVGDILTEEFGEEEFDIIFFGSLLYFFNGEQLGRVFGRAYKALKPGGTIVINHVIADEERCASEEALLLAVQLYIFHPESHVYSFSEYRELLTRAGFADAAQHSGSLLSARKEAKQKSA